MVIQLLFYLKKLIFYKIVFQVFPYLVIVVGLENMLIIIKSVGSTAPNLDVKIRLAQGLSKEGWAITQNLLIEVTILTGGLLTFVPSIQVIHF